MKLVGNFFGQFESDHSTHFSIIFKIYFFNEKLIVRVIRYLTLHFLLSRKKWLFVDCFSITVYLYVIIYFVVITVYI